MASIKTLRFDLGTKIGLGIFAHKDSNRGYAVKLDKTSKGRLEALQLIEDMKQCIKELEDFYNS